MMLFQLLQFITIWGHVVAVLFILFAVGWRVFREPRMVLWKRFREGIISLVTFGLIGGTAYAVVVILKRIFHVARPFAVGGYEAIVAVPLFDSFPSGHAFVLGALAGATWKFSKKLSIILLVLTFVVSVGRVYFGLHYVSDIIFGMLLGVPLGYFFWYELHHLDIMERVIAKLK